jgi:hypothetical protein
MSETAERTFGTTGKIAGTGPKTAATFGKIDSIVVITAADWTGSKIGMTEPRTRLTAERIAEIGGRMSAIGVRIAGTGAPAASNGSDSEDQRAGRSTMVAPPLLLPGFLTGS